MRWVRIFKSREDAESAIEEGKARRVVIGDHRIALARWKDEYYAIQDACPHSSAYLSQGWVNPRGEIICPLHNYCYDLKTGREYKEQSADASTWRTRMDTDGLFIELE